MDVKLSPALEAYVKAALESGRFQSVDELVSAALELFERQPAEALHPRVDPVLKELTQGGGIEGEAVIETPKGKLEESQEDERVFDR